MVGMHVACQKQLKLVGMSVLTLLLSAGCARSVRGPATLGPAQGGEWAHAQELDAFVVAEMESRSIPGAVVVTLEGGRTRYARGYGLADVGAGAAASPHTQFAIGSLTKTFVAALILSLRDEGALALSDPLWNRLPRNISASRQSRGLPLSPVQISDVLSHVGAFPRLPAGLKSSGTDKYAGYTCANLDEAIAQTDLPGLGSHSYVYSNFGYSALGRVAEHASGLPFAELLQSRILGPLGLTHTWVSWSRAEPPELAKGYVPGDSARVQPVWKHGCLAPQGALISSGLDMARWLEFWLDGTGGRVMRTKSIAEAVSPLHRAEASTDGAWFEGPIDHMDAIEPTDDADAPPPMLAAAKGVAAGKAPRLGRRLPSESWVGLGWHVRVLSDGRLLVEHAGLVGGFASYIGFCPSEQVGVVVLVNRQVSIGARASRILDWLIDLPGRHPSKVSQSQPHGSQPQGWAQSENQRPISSLAIMMR